MKNTILILLVFTSLTISSYSADLYRVYLKDKGNQTLEFGNQLYKDILTNLDKKAIERRKINLKTDNILSEKDIPIYEKYLDTLSELAIVKSKLKWYNYIIAEIDSSQLDIIQNLSFVNEVQSVLQHYSTDNNLVLLENCDRFEYNYSFNHLFMLNIPDLHRYGITGEGVRIGFLDSGFDYLQHNSLNNIKIGGTYDFIFRDSIVYNEEEDVSSQDNHGSVVLATVASFENMKYIGVAPNAEFYLAKTEDLRSETYYELDLYAEAIIWMENNGVDIVNSSLGYRDLDTLSLNFPDLDGNYTIAAKAINDASELGMICVVSAGNDGDSPQTIGSPADADSAVAVGALNQDGETLVGFSSNGPNANGMMKPNLVAQGAGIYSINPNTEDRYGMTSGTSLSAPLIAGCFGLIKSVYSNTESSNLKQSIFKSADKYSTPDNRFGYGLPDMFKAINDYGVAISPVNQLDNGEFKRLVFYIFPEKQILNASLYIEYSEFSKKMYPLVKKGFDNQYYVDVPKSMFESGIAFARCIVNSYSDDYYYPSKDSLFEVYLDGFYIQCGVNQNEITPEEQISPENGFDVFPTVSNGADIQVAAVLQDNYNMGISLTNIEGKKIQTEYINFGPGVLNQSISVSNLLSGTYFVTLEYGGKQFVKKIIILR